MRVTWFTWDTRCRGDSLLLFNHISIVGFEGLRGKKRKKTIFVCMYLLQVGQILAMRCRCRTPDFDITGRIVRPDIEFNSDLFPFLRIVF